MVGVVEQVVSGRLVEQVVSSTSTDNADAEATPVAVDEEASTGVVEIKISKSATLRTSPAALSVVDDDVVGNVKT